MAAYLIHFLNTCDCMVSRWAVQVKRGLVMHAKGMDADMHSDEQFPLLHTFSAPRRIYTTLYMYLNKERFSTQKCLYFFHKSMCYELIETPQKPLLMSTSNMFSWRYKKNTYLDATNNNWHTPDSSRQGTFFNQKKLIFFLFLHKNIHCGYSLEVPRHFCGEIRKIFTLYSLLSKAMSWLDSIYAGGSRTRLFTDTHRSLLASCCCLDIKDCP